MPADTAYRTNREVLDWTAALSGLKTIWLANGTAINKLSETVLKGADFSPVGSPWLVSTEVLPLSVQHRVIASFN